MLCTITLARGFASFDGGLAFIRHHQSGRRTTQFHVSLEELSDFIPNDRQSCHSSEKKIELWLDLRGTAIHPGAAVEYLQEQVVDELAGVSDLSSVFDRIIVSGNMFQKLLTSDGDYTEEESEILYVPEDTPAQLALSHGGLSFPFGSLIQMEGSMAVPDPITAMETLSGGQWIVLYNEEEEIEDEDSRIAAVGDFVNIATTAAGDWGSTTQLESGLLVQTGHSKEEGGTIGGIAVQCSTKSSIMHLASTIESAVSGRSPTTTESGILIQGERGEASPLSFALMLPFDVSLWKAALVLYGKHDEEDV